MNLYLWETWELILLVNTAVYFLLPTKNVNYFYTHEGEN